MADNTDDPEIAASRLEAALERIAQHAAAPKTNTSAAPGAESTAAPTATPEIAERLDVLIDRLRGALAPRMNL